MLGLPGSKWTTKPPLGPGLDRAHPLVRGLVGCWLFNEGAGSSAKDLGERYPMALNAGVSRATGGDGGALGFDGSSGAATCAAPVTGPYTVIARARPTGASGVRNVFTSGTAGAYGFQLRQDGGDWSLYQFDTTDRLAAYAGGVTAGAWHDLAGSWDGATLRLSVNGTPRGSVGVLSVRSGTTTTVGADGSDYGGGFGQFWLGRISFVYLYSRALSASEVASVHSDPYQMILAPAARRFFAAAVGGGTSYADSVSFAETLGLTLTGAATAGGTLSLAATLAVAESATASAFGSASLAGSLGQSQYGSASASGSLGLTVAQQIAQQGSASSADSLSLALALAQTLAAASQAGASVSYSVTAGLTPSAAATASGSAAFAVTEALSFSGLASSSGALSLSEALSLLVTTGQLVQADLAFGVTQALSLTGSATINVSLSLAETLGLSLAGSAGAQAAATLAVALAISAVAQAAASAGLSLTVVEGDAFDGTAGGAGQKVVKIQLISAAGVTRLLMILTDS